MVCCAILKGAQRLPLPCVHKKWDAAICGNHVVKTYVQNTDHVIDVDLFHKQIVKRDMEKFGAYNQ